MTYEIEQHDRYAGEYTLTAELDGETLVESVYGDTEGMPANVRGLFAGSTEPRDVADSDATMAAIPRVLNRAAAANDPDADDRERAAARVWAKGRVTLTAPDGRIVRVMEPKQP